MNSLKEPSYAMFLCARLISSLKGIFRARLIRTRTVARHVLLKASLSRTLLAKSGLIHPSLSHHHIPVTLWHVFLGAHARPQIDDETEDVEGEDEGDGPFEDRSDVAVACI